MKKFLSILLIICMLAPMFAFAEEENAEIEVTANAAETHSEPDKIEESAVEKESAAEKAPDPEKAEIGESESEVNETEADETEQKVSEVIKEDEIVTEEKAPAAAMHADVCSHPNKVVYNEWDDVLFDEFRDLGDGTHSGVKRHVELSNCPDCGGVGIQSEIRTPFTEKHDYITHDGVMTCYYCGNVNTCTHEKTEFRLKRYFDSDYESVDNGDGTHKRMALDADEGYCPDCGQFVQNVITGWRIIDEDHYYVDSVCLNCGAVNSCKHDNCELDTSWYYAANHEITDNGDGTHHGWVYYYYMGECPDCDQSIAIYEDEPCEADLPHQWEYNNCINCGAEFTCSHENCEFEEDTEYDNEYEAVDNGDGTHTARVRDYVYGDCPDCGDRVEKDHTDWYITTEDAHRYEEGVCWVCGAEIHCEHNDVYTEESYNYDWNSDVRDNGDGTHTAMKYNYLYIYCRDCNTVLVNDRDEPYEVTEDHLWNDDGICWVCNAENTCTHENTHFSRSEGYDWEKTITDNGDGTHTAWKLDYSYGNCPDCGAYVRKDVTEPYEVTEPHDWDDDVCWVCDAENTCTHDNLVEDYDDTDYLRNRVDNGDGTHTAIVRDYTRCICQDCGASVRRYTSDEYELTENHIYYDGECWVCGAENTCEHPNTIKESWSYRSGKEIFGTTDLSHMVNMILVTEERCADCGEWLEDARTEEPYVGSERHSFENGICSVCGYENTCTHAKTLQELETDYNSAKPVPGIEAHARTRTIYKVTYCAKCGETLKKETLKDAFTQIEPHNYNYNGKCYECGYANTCAHKHTNTRTWTSSVSEYRFESSTQHSYDGIEVTITECIDCGQYINREEASNSSPYIENHYFYNGICTDCGYENTCKHGTTETKNTTYIQTISVDAKEHTVLKLAQKYIVCTKCGTEVSSVFTGDPVIVTESHAFCAQNNYNACNICGYAYDGVTAVCKHSTAVKAPAVKATCTEEGMTAGTVCAKCGIVLSGCQVIPALGHTEAIDPAVEPTCEMSGLTEGLHCSVCGEVFTEQETVPALGHKPIVDDAIDPTCTSTGLTEGSHCEVCDVILTAQEIIEKLPHIFDDKFVCTVCGTVSSIQTIHIGGDVVLAAKELYMLPVSYEPMVAKDDITFSTTNPKVATVNAYGRIAAVAAGTAMIIANSGDVSASIEVTVLAAATKVTVSPASLILETGEESILSAQVTGHTSAIIWTSSNTDVAIVDEEGRVTAVDAGTAVIKAAATNGKYATCKVTVAKPAVLTGVRVDPEKTAQMDIGTKMALITTLVPQDAEAAVTFKSSSAKVASVDTDGVISANAVGSATITVTAAQGKVKKTASVKITVVDPAAPASVSLDHSGNESMFIGDAMKITATVLPATCEAEPVFKSSAPTVVSVDQSGNMMALKAGSATITATVIYGKIKKIASVKVKVTDPLVPVMLTLNVPKTMNLEIGDSWELTASRVPETAEGTITWKSSNTGVVSCTDGKVTALKAGSATITATITRGKVKKSISTKITVIDPNKLTSVLLQVTGTQELRTGLVFRLIPSIAGSNAPAVLTWKSSAPAVASVDEDGMVTANAPGTATITVTAQLGKVKKTASVKIKVV